MYISLVPLIGRTYRKREVDGGLAFGRFGYRIYYTCLSGAVRAVLADFHEEQRRVVFIEMAWDISSMGVPGSYWRLSSTA